MPRGERSGDLRLRTFVSEFAIGEPVYLRHANDALCGLVVRVVFGAGSCRYVVSWEDGSRSPHETFELLREPHARVDESFFAEADDDEAIGA